MDTYDHLNWTKADCSINEESEHKSSESKQNEDAFCGSCTKSNVINIKIQICKDWGKCKVIVENDEDDFINVEECDASCASQQNHLDLIQNYMQHSLFPTFDIENDELNHQPTFYDTTNCLKEVGISELDHELQPNCVICTEDIRDAAVKLNCKHLFHKDCIDEWINIHEVCPVCRAEIK